MKRKKHRVKMNKFFLLKKQMCICFNAHFQTRQPHTSQTYEVKHKLQNTI